VANAVLYKRLSTILLATCVLAFAAEPAQLHLDVHTSSTHGYVVTPTLVCGNEELLLIDPQFLLSEAREAVAGQQAPGASSAVPCPLTRRPLRD